MKKMIAVTMCILVAGAVIILLSTPVLAGPGGAPGKHGHGHGGHHWGHHGHHGHHGHWYHHRPHWSPVIGVASTYVADDECYWTKRCFRDEFGRKHCRLVKICDE